jgi:hypothetical protein
MEDKARYLQFPLFLLRTYFEDRTATLNNILVYGIYKYSTKFDYKDDDVAKHLIYANYNHRTKLPVDLLKKLDSLDSDIIGLDDYRGFADKIFAPEAEIAEIFKAFNSDDKFYKDSIEYYQICLAVKSTQVTTGSEKSILEKAKKIEQKIAPKESMPMVSVKLLFDFRDNEKSNFEDIQLLFFLAIKSILGTFDFVKTNKKLILARAIGYKSHKELPSELGPVLNNFLVKYSKRYHFDKIKTELEFNWNIISYSHHNRGLYFSIKSKYSLDQLALKCESNKRKNKIKALADAKADARSKAIKKLNDEILNN